MARHFSAIDFATGTTGSLDFLWQNNDLLATDANPQTGDIATVISSDRAGFYHYDETSSLVADGESVIDPVSPHTGDGRWLLRGGLFRDLKITVDITALNDGTSVPYSAILVNDGVTPPFHDYSGILSGCITYTDVTNPPAGAANRGINAEVYVNPPAGSYPNTYISGVWGTVDIHEKCSADIGSNRENPPQIAMQANCNHYGNGQSYGAIGLRTRINCRMPFNAWALTQIYTAGDLVHHNPTGTKSIRYRCIQGHTADASTEPGVGSSWSNVWVQEASGQMLYACHVYMVNPRQASKPTYLGVDPTATEGIRDLYGLYMQTFDGGYRTNAAVQFGDDDPDTGHRGLGGFYFMKENGIDTMHQYLCSDYRPLLILQAFNDGAGISPSMRFEKARGTQTNPADVIGGDILNRTWFGAYRNGAWNYVCEWRALMDSTVTDDSLPSKFQFYTTPPGSIARRSTPSLEIGSNGQLTIDTTTGTSDPAYLLKASRNGWDHFWVDTYGGIRTNALSSNLFHAQYNNIDQFTIDKNGRISLFGGFTTPVSITTTSNPITATRTGITFDPFALEWETLDLEPHINLRLQANSRPVLYVESYIDTTARCPQLSFRKAAGSASLPSNVSDGHALGGMFFSGYSSGFQISAWMQTFVEGTFTSGNKVPTRINFTVTDSGANRATALDIMPNRWLFIADTYAVPSTNPVGGGYLYVEAGALKYRGPNGTVTTIANV